MFVSPVFELPMGRPVSFRMMLEPRDTCQNGGIKSFSKARGFGIIKLKCEEALAEVEKTALTFKLSAVGAAWRGPVRHDFSSASVAGLPSGGEEWNFRSVVDASQTFTV